MKTPAFKTTLPKLRSISDKRHSEDAGCPDAGWKPLSSQQKNRLAILARQAFENLKVQGMTATEWRHEMAIQKVGCRISEAKQKHWTDLKSMFQDLAGKHGPAYKTQIRAADNKRRVALHKLTLAIQERNLHISYAQSICMTQFKVPLEEASAKQIWCLFYTVTNRRRKS